MPLNWTIEPDLRLVAARAEGALSAEDIKAYFESIAALTAADLQALGRSTASMPSTAMTRSGRSPSSWDRDSRTSRPCDTSRRLRRARAVRR